MIGSRMSAHQGASTRATAAGPGFGAWALVSGETLSTSGAGPDDRVGLVVDGLGGAMQLRLGALAALEPGADPAAWLILATDRATAPEWLAELKDLHPAAPSAFTALITNLMEGLAEMTPVMREEDAVATVESILRLARTALGRPYDALPPPGLEGDPEMLAAARLIERDLLDPDLDANSLTRALGLSRSSLYRAFQSVGGVKAYIRQRRLEHARDLLMRRDGPRLTVGEVAQACGFASDSHFSRAFRKAFGYSPGVRPEAEGSGGA